MQEVQGLKQQLATARHASAAAAAASNPNATLPPPGAVARGGASRRNMPLGLSLDSKLAAAVAAAGRVAAEGGEGGAAGPSGVAGGDTDALGMSYALSNASDGSGDWQSIASSPDRLANKLPGVTGWGSEPVTGDAPAPAAAAAAAEQEGEQRDAAGGRGRSLSRTASDQLAAAGAFNTREGAQAAARAAAASTGSSGVPPPPPQQQQQVLLPWTAEQQAELDQLRRLNQQLQTQIQALQQQHQQQQQQQQQQLPLSGSPPPSSSSGPAAAAAVLHRHRLQSALGLQRTGSGGVVGGGSPGRHQRAMSVDLGE
jgi:hypothetical protein